MEFAVLVKLAIWMPESFLYGEKCIELIINKTAVIIDLAIFISAYIPNFFMDVNMQSSIFFLSTEQKALNYKERETQPENVERALGLPARAKNWHELKQKRTTLFQCNKNWDINFVGIF